LPVGAGTVNRVERAGKRWTKKPKPGSR
jgi:hypothetical protein